MTIGYYERKRKMLKMKVPMMRRNELGRKPK